MDDSSIQNCPTPVSSYDGCNNRRKLFDGELKIKSKIADSGVIYEDIDELNEDNSGGNNSDRSEMSQFNRKDSAELRQSIILKQSQKLELQIKIRRQTETLQQKGQSIIRAVEQQQSQKEQDKERQSMTVPMIKNKDDKKSIWTQSVFLIIGLVNRFQVKLKETTLFFKPDKLTKYQLNIIKDHSAKGPEDGWGINDQIVNQFTAQNSFFKQNGCFYKFLKRLAKIQRMIGQAKVIKTSGKFLRNINQTVPIFYAHNILHVIWDFIVMVTIIVKVIFIPLEIGYDLTDLIESNVGQVLIPLIFLLNAGVSANTSFFQSGILIQDRILIIMHYLKEQFLYDFFMIFTLMNNYDNFLPIAIILYVVLIAKAFSTQQSFEYIHNKIQFGVKMTSIKDLLSLFCKILYFNHLFACVIHWIGMSEYKQGQNNWLQIQNIETADFFDRYVTSFYFGTVTMCTVGFGDIYPISISERICITILTFFSTAIFGYTLNSIGYILIELGKREKQHKAEIFQLNKYMKQHDVDPLLQNQARKYAQFLHNEELDNQENHGSCLSILSVNMREHILKNIFYQQLANVPFLQKNFSKSLLENLAVKVKEKLLGPGDILMQNGDKIEPSLFMVDQGKLEISVTQNKDINDDENNTIFKSISKNQYFGQYQFFTNSQEAHFTVTSIGISTIFYINISDFLDVMNESAPSDREVFYSIKDTLIFSKKLDVVNMSCFSCQSIDHLATQCPFLVYGGDKYKMLRHLNKQDAQFRGAYQRQKDSKNTLVEFQKLLLTALRWKQINFQYTNTYSDVYFLDDDEAFLDNDHSEEDLLMLQMGHQFDDSEIEHSDMASSQNGDFTSQQMERSYESQAISLENQLSSRKISQDLEQSLWQMGSNRAAAGGSNFLIVESNQDDQAQTYIRQRSNEDQKSLMVSSGGGVSGYTNSISPFINTANKKELEQDDKVNPSPEKIKFQRRMNKNLTFLEKQRKIFEKNEGNGAPENQDQQDAEITKKKIFLKKSQSFNMNDYHFDAEQKDIIKEAENQIIKKIQAKEDTTNTIKEMFSILTQVHNMVNQQQQQNQNNSIWRSNSSRFTKMDSIASQQQIDRDGGGYGDPNDLVDKQSEAINSEVYSHNNDMDQVKSYDLYFPKYNIDNIKKQYKQETEDLDSQNYIFESILKQKITTLKSQKFKQENDKSFKEKDSIADEIMEDEINENK